LPPVDFHHARRGEPGLPERGDKAVATLSYMAAGADQHAISPALLALETERAN